MRRIAVAAALGCLLSGAAMAQEGRARVIDGDSLEVAGEAIRLNGIDAPEARQTCRDAFGEDYACGQSAARALQRLVEGRTVTCRTLERDRYGRRIAVCEAGGVELNRAMVEGGWAMAFPRYSADYVEDEGMAARAQRGIWSGSFAAPWDWRRIERQTEVAQTDRTAPSDCRIKGNISGAGRIYHVPGSEHYADTRINPGRGERWFCTEAEAIAAGWRAPRS